LAAEGRTFGVEALESAVARVPDSRGRGIEEPSATSAGIDHHDFAVQIFPNGIIGFDPSRRHIAHFSD
jgi:hypothetical protein